MDPSESTRRPDSIASAGAKACGVSSSSTFVSRVVSLLVIYRRIVVATSSNNFSIKIQLNDSNRSPEIHISFLSNSAKVGPISLRVSRSAHERISVIVRIVPVEVYG